MDEKELVMKSEEKSDTLSKTKTIYDATLGEIVWRNFLAGASRGLGGVFVYLIFILILGLLFLNIVLPKLMPLINNYLNIFNSLQSVNNLPQKFDLRQLMGQ